MQPADEGIGRRLHSRVPRILSAGRALASAETDTDTAAEDTDADAAAEDTDADAAAEDTDTDAAAEGDDAGSSACPNFDLTALIVPGDLGAGTVSNGTEDAADTGGLGTPATDVPAEPTRRRLMGEAPRMPLVETEAAAVVRVVQRRRTLLDAAAEGEPAADGEGAAGATETEIDFSDAATLEVSAAVLGDAVSGGVCDGAFTTPAGQHAMVNQDIVFAQAREIDGVQYFRVVDMFTPSRSKPQPDFEFGGTDDITDAWGAPSNAPPVCM